MRQILFNLIGNAIKFTRQGGVRVRLRCEGKGNETHLVFDVIDTGIGLTPGQIPSIFDPFHQADTSTTRRYGGTGLGLTVSRQLAEILGDNISVESKFGRGSTFTLRIPAPAAAPRSMGGKPEWTRDFGQPPEGSAAPH